MTPTYRKMTRIESRSFNRGLLIAVTVSVLAALCIVIIGLTTLKHLL